jgi:ABC-type transporter Mla subunit MlaD
LAVLALAAVLAAVAAGCGGDEDEGARSEAWADDVCTSVSSWQDSLRSAVDSLQGEGTVEERIDGALSEAREATDQLRDDLGDLEAPATEAGAEARDEVDELLEQLRAGIDAIRSAAEGVSGVSEALEAVSVVTAQVAAMGEAVSSALSRLGSLDAGEELSDAFRNEESCQELRERGS